MILTIIYKCFYYVECKGYVNVGYAQYRNGPENMPSHDEVTKNNDFELPKEIVEAREENKPRIVFG